MVQDFLPYGRQTITDEDVTAVTQAMRETLITRGPQVEAFEEAVAGRCDVKHAIAFCNGTAALQAAYFAGEVSPHDHIITTPNSFVASIMGVAQGATPLFVDIDRKHGGMDIEKVDELLNQPRTRGKTFLVPVHFAGIALDMAALEEKVKSPDTVTIEDAAHAIGSTYPSGEPVGSCVYSDMTIFSFHPVKNITSGEGGMVTTNDDTLAERLRFFRNNGMVREPEKGSWVYRVDALTGNYNITDFQAALGLSQLQRIDEISEKRRQVVSWYRKHLDGARLFSEEFDPRTCYHLLVAQFDFGATGKTRQDLIQSLQQQGIGTQVHYVPLYHHPVVGKKEHWTDQCPEMEAYYASALSLPLFPDMTENDVEKVSASIAEFELANTSLTQRRKGAERILS